MEKLEKAVLNSEIKKTGDNEYSFIMSDETIDRDGEIIKVDGWDLKNYKKNSILLWGHNHSVPGIGVVGSVVIEDGKLIAKRVRFASPGVYLLADTVRGLVDDGILKATSVGYLPKEREYPQQNDDKGTKKPKARVITSKQELYELSIINVGSNPNALRELKSVERSAEKGFTGDPAQYLDDIFEKEEDFELDEKPYPNEHACRLRDPNDFRDNTFKRYSRTHEGKKYDIIAGKLKGETSMTEQAYRYKKNTWKASEARAHCRVHKGTFEAAAGEDSLTVEETEEKFNEIKSMINDLTEAIKQKQRSGKYDDILAVDDKSDTTAEPQKLPLKQPSALNNMIRR